MDEINDMLGFESEVIEIKFMRIWRLAIFGVNCKQLPQVNITDGVVLPSAFDLREEVGDKKIPEKSLSFLKLDEDNQDIKIDEQKHIEILATGFKKNSPDELRKNRCSILISNSSLTNAANSDPLNRALLKSFLFIETTNGKKKSKFSQATGMHWEGHYLSKSTLEILNIKSMLSKCAKIINP